MRIALLYFDGCSSHEMFLPHLRELLDRTGVDAPVRLRRIETDGAAQCERFLGSPTLRIDGIDVDPGARYRTDYGMKCRLYPADGRLCRTPPDQWILDALKATEEGSAASADRPGTTASGALRAR